MRPLAWQENVLRKYGGICLWIHLGSFLYSSSGSRIFGRLSETFVWIIDERCQSSGRDDGHVLITPLPSTTAATPRVALLSSSPSAVSYSIICISDYSDGSCALYSASLHLPYSHQTTMFFRLLASSREPRNLPTMPQIFNARMCSFQCSCVLSYHRFTPIIFLIFGGH